MDSANAFILQANDLVESMGMAKFDPINILPDGNKAQAVITQLEAMISKLEAAKNIGHNWDSANFESKEWQALALLQQAKLWTLGFSPIHEGDIGNWLTSKGLGLNVTSINDSASANARIVGDIVNQYKGVIQEAFEKETYSWSVMMKKFYKHMRPGVGITGGEVDIFDDWILKDSSGNMDPSFSFVDPDTISDPVSKEALEKTLELLAKHRFNNDPVLIQEAKDNGSYYEIPLCKASTQRQIRQAGIKDAIKN